MPCLSAFGVSAGSRRSILMDLVNIGYICHIVVTGITQYRPVGVYTSTPINNTNNNTGLSLSPVALPAPDDPYALVRPLGEGGISNNTQQHQQQQQRLPRTPDGPHSTPQVGMGGVYRGAPGASAAQHPLHPECGSRIYSVGRCTSYLPVLTLLTPPAG